jgi:YesN/AraC family two-component response regulator
MVQSLANILELKGYRVSTAFSGQEALETLHNCQCDILLTDVRMPDMNGVDLYRATRESHPDLLTILMTAYAADDIIRDGLKEGIKTVLTKPLDINFLLMLLSAAVSAYSA